MSDSGSVKASTSKGQQVDEASSVPSHVRGEDSSYHRNARAVPLCSPLDKHNFTSMGEGVSDHIVGWDNSPQWKCKPGNAVLICFSVQLFCSV